MRLKTPWFVFTTRWSSTRLWRPYFTRWFPNGGDSGKKVALVWLGCAIAERKWWNHWTDNGRRAA
ncbi:MAG: hypothetical protein KGL39_39440 [Patescibacteria group bacterium]|nr:hypothetical protein [Patescibacteria group bacterium]